MFNIVYSFLSFTLHLSLCCTLLGLVLYYLVIQPLAARVFYQISYQCCTKASCSFLMPKISAKFQQGYPTWGCQIEVG